MRAEDPAKVMAEVVGMVAEATEMVAAPRWGSSTQGMGVDRD